MQSLTHYSPTYYSCILLKGPKQLQKLFLEMVQQNTAKSKFLPAGHPLNSTGMRHNECDGKERCGMRPTVFYNLNSFKKLPITKWTQNKYKMHVCIMHIRPVTIKTEGGPLIKKYTVYLIRGHQLKLKILRLHRKDLGHVPSHRVFFERSSNLFIGIFRE